MKSNCVSLCFLAVTLAISYMALVTAATLPN